MPQQPRLESRRTRRKQSSAAPIAIAALVVVVLAAGGAWWIFASRPHSAATGGTAPAQQAASAQTSATAPATTPAKPAVPPVTPSADASSADVSPATLAAAEASLKASKKAAVRFPGAPAISATTPSLNHLNPKHKYIALTLDDGYNYQPALLQLLVQYHVHCTTFLIGSWAAAHKADVKAMRDAGFEIGNHSWSHPFLTKLSTSAVASELTRTERVLSSITGVQAPYLRPPFGATNPTVKAVAASLGFRIVMWDRTFGDSGRGATPTKLYSNVVYSGGGVKPGDIILCHWGSKPSYEALKKILPDLQAKGFQFVTISELVADSK